MAISSGLLYDQQVSDNIQGAAAMPSIPREAILDTVPRSALAATKKIVNLVPITAGSVSANQTVQFLIPQRNLMKAASAYLKFKIRVTGIATKFSFSGSLASAAAVINNITIQAGGVVLESLQNYHLWHNNVLSWAHQGNDELAIEALCSGSKLPLTSAGAFAAKANPAAAAALNNYTQEVLGYSYQNSNTGGGNNTPASNTTVPTYDNTKQFPAATLEAVFSIPILSGVLNPKESQLVPLQFINGGMLLTIQTNAVSKAFFESGATPSASAAYELSDMELCYAEITPAPEYILRIREEMMAGKMIKIEAQSYQQYNVAAQQSVRQNFNVNLSSVSSIFWGRTFASDSTVTSKCFAGYGNDSDVNFRYEMYLDNVLLFNSANQLNSVAVQVRQLQEALASTVSDYAISPFVNCRGNNVTYDTANQTSPIATTADNSLYTSAMLWGLSTKLFASNSTSMDGTPIGVLTINFYGGNSLGTSGVPEAAASNNLWYIYVVYDYIYLVDATGSVSKNQ